MRRVRQWSKALNTIKPRASKTTIERESSAAPVGGKLGGTGGAGIGEPLGGTGVLVGVAGEPPPNTTSLVPVLLLGSSVVLVVVSDAMLRLSGGAALAMMRVVIVMVITSPGATLPKSTVTVLPLTETVPRGLELTLNTCKNAGIGSVTTTLVASTLPRLVTVNVKIASSPTWA